MTYVMEEDHRRKLTDEQLSTLQADYKRGVSPGVLAIKYGVSRAHVYTLITPERLNYRRQYMKHYQRKNSRG
jgi:hypothetical protein